MRKNVGQEREVTEVAIVKATGVRLSKPFGSHIRLPHAQGARRGAIGLNVCLHRFFSCFDHISSFYAPIHPFWNGNVNSVSMYIDSMKLGI